MRISENRLKVISEKMQMVADDTRKDAEEFNGKPFDGRTVAKYFGVIGAQIQAIAFSLQELVDAELEHREDERTLK